MNRIYLSLFLAVSLGFAQCQPKAVETEEISSEPAVQPVQTGNLVNPTQFEKMVKEGAQIIDVRTASEIQKGYIEGATQIDFQDPSFQQKIQQLDKSKTYLVYCAIGGRSKSTQQYMSSLGFTSVYDLEGGIRAWQRAGKEIVK